MREETIAQLKKISVPRIFPKNEYICHEGQPGNEMYIILKGSVGVFITSAIGTLTHVATIQSGNFFGEMAIFDNLPRSASCITLEDTIAIAVTKDNLQEFLATCPDIAGQMLEKMSGRIRKLDAELYQNNRFVKNRHVTRFSIPAEFKTGHAVRMPYQDKQFLQEYKQACPICGKAVTAVEVKRNILQVRNFDNDCRIRYAGCEPLWKEVLACPHCYYTNHYLKFFGINNFEFEEVSRVLEREHKPVLEARLEKRSEYDKLVINYLQAIHINEHINPEAGALIGGLWRNLYWLSKDVDDDAFALYCARQAVTKFKSALDENRISDLYGKCTTALSLVNLMMYCKESSEVMKYIEIAIESPDEKVRNIALQTKALIERRADM